MDITTIETREKLVFELSAEELTERLRPTAEKLMKEAWAKGSYITYYSEELCPDTDHMIHEYADRKELVKIMEDGSQFIRLI